MLIGFVQGYEELKWGISKPNPLCNGPCVDIIIYIHVHSVGTVWSYECICEQCYWFPHTLGHNIIMS